MQPGAPAYNPPAAGGDFHFTQTRKHGILYWYVTAKAGDEAMDRYRIAGLTVQMACGGKTRAQSEPYRLAQADGENVDLCLTVTPQEQATAQAAHPELSGADWEYMLTGQRFYDALPRFDGLLLHASAVKWAGRAFLFSAPSGGGKSTHARHWQEAFGAQAVILNDDKPALRLRDGTFWAYGTPWSGKTPRNRNDGAPVAAICFLEKAAADRIEPLEAPQALPRLLEQTLRPADEAGMAALLGLLDRLLRQVPVYLCHCTDSVDAARVACRELSRGRQAANQERRERK